MTWLTFLLSAAGILCAGLFLTRQCSRLSQVTGIGEGWLGAFLLGSVTSLPELSVTVSAHSWVGSSELAMTNILGSNLFNLLILAMIWLFFTVPRPHGISRITLSLAVWILPLLLGLGMTVGKEPFPHLGASPFSLITLLLFLVGLYFSGRSEGKRKALLVGDSPPEGKVGPILLRMLPLVGVIVIAGSYASRSAEQIALSTGLGNTFVGTLLLGIATSLPEIAVTLSAARQGSASMAAGNIFGSNAFNHVVLGVADLLPPSTSIFAPAQPIHLLQLGFALLLSLLLSFLLLFPPSSTPKRITTKAIAFSCIALYLTILTLTRYGV